MSLNFCLKIAGSAGQGIQTIGGALTKVYSRGGYRIFAHQDYHSRIRGGHNFFQIKVSKSDRLAVDETLDIVLALNAESVIEHRDELKPHGVVLYDADKCPEIAPDKKLLNIPLHKLAVSLGGKPVFLSSVAAGAALGMVGFGLELLEDLFKNSFAQKPEMLEGNLKAAKAGYQYADVHFSSGFPIAFPAGDRQVPAMVINGNQAIALGALAAGCSFYCAYPMSPATGIMAALAHYEHKCDLFVEQAEDEISAVNMALGASYAGARAMTGTSGGGFALMAEGVSLAGMTETPLVIALAQRPGPATGLPTRSEQGDLLFSLAAGHGEFPRAVFTPGTAEEAFELTFKSFNLADKYQVPVIILTDQHLADCYRNPEPFSTRGMVVERFLGGGSDKNDIDYTRYRITESGVSPRRVPGKTRGLVVVDSDEHTEDGHITEDLEIRLKMVDKRLRKLEGMKKEIVSPKSYGPPVGEILLMGYGSTYGAIKETVHSLNAAGKAVAALHFPQVWPFPVDEIRDLRERYRKIFMVENNATGQLAWIIRAETGLEVDGKILKYDGRAFTVSYLIEVLHGLL
ncbi:MAG: 2-oxoacid:acceptor oxidoreductase subunit alpha [bacterium]